ncbi:MAG: ABC transporter transmembrane domain-containing protein [Candidatus Symbiobacter sp.]|nr:ABC transporter transmembrane domain-containing protein [Candidatus Symbiobacter sp.]
MMKIADNSPNLKPNYPSSRSVNNIRSVQPPPLSQEPIHLPTTALVKRLVSEYVRPHAARLAFALVAMVVVAATTAGLAKMMEPLLNDVFTRHDPAALTNVATIIFALFLAKGLGGYGEQVLMNGIGQSIVAALQSAMFRRLVVADLGFLHKNPTGSLIARMTNDVGMLRTIVTNTLTGLGKDVLTVVLLVAVMVWQDWVLSLIALVVFPTAIMPIARQGRRMRKVSNRTQNEVSRLVILLEQVFQGMRHVKAYGMESYEIARTDQVIGQILGFVKKSGRIRAIASPIMEILGGVAVVAVVAYGGSQVIAGTRTTGTFFSFLTALLLAYEPVKRLANLNANLQEGLASAQRVFAVIDSAPSIVDAPNAVPLRLTKGDIAFKNVRFSYGGGRGNALDGINLTIKSGEKLALVGKSGGGKSTLLNLIPRFYDPDHGMITIDGQDIRGVTMASLRQSIALVSQEVILFDDTVAMNIAYGRQGADFAAIEQAARQAAAFDFIHELPQGWQTRVGEFGVTLSGGQRQRIAIARAILKNAPILLLDEATSALDSDSERLVQAALDQLMQNRTVLVIAHRLSTIQNADQICVLDAGHIIEQGSHAQLLGKNQFYARLYASSQQNQPSQQTQETQA